MSVGLSQIKFNHEAEEEEEMEAEDARQELELKAFLDKELDEDFLLEDSFHNSSHNNKSYHDNRSYHATGNGDPYNGQTVNYRYQLGEEIPAYQPNDERGNLFENINNKLTNQRDAICNNETSPNEPRGNLHDNNNLYPPNNEKPGPIFNGNFPNNQNNDFKLLYEERGRKIQSLQKEIEEKEEVHQKENRVLQHRLTMSAAELSGVQSSNEQLSALVAEHKQEIEALQAALIEEQQEKQHLNHQLSETAEKLEISDATIDALQRQITELNTTESRSKTRAHHENVMATLREKHREEVLFHKEKCDDLQQRLSWKTEEVNRYKEMIDSNSHKTEIESLQAQLTSEEAKTKKQDVEIERLANLNNKLEEQLNSAEQVLLRSNHQQASTPLNNLAGRAKLDFKTPFTGKQQVATGSPDNNREELIKALSINRTNRQEIKTLTEQLEKLRKSCGNCQILQQKLRQNNENCENCQSLQQQLRKNNNENLHQNYKSAHTNCANCHTMEERLSEMVLETREYERKVGEFMEEANELKHNMREMVSTHDKEKVSYTNKHTNEVLQLLDTAKQAAREQTHEQYRNQLQTLDQQIQELKEQVEEGKKKETELNEEIGRVERRIREESNESNQKSMFEAKQEMHAKHQDEIIRLRNKLTNKHIKDLDLEKQRLTEEFRHQQEADEENIATLSTNNQQQMEENKKLSEKHSDIVTSLKSELASKNSHLEDLLKEKSDLEQEISKMRAKEQNSSKEDQLLNNLIEDFAVQSSRSIEHKSRGSQTVEDSQKHKKLVSDVKVAVLQLRDLQHVYVSLKTFATSRLNEYRNEEKSVRNRVVSFLRQSEMQTNMVVKEAVRTKTNALSKRNDDLEKEMGRVSRDHQNNVSQLKQSFREKLEKISEIKKNWIKEEEEKRLIHERQLEELFAVKERKMLKDQTEKERLLIKDHTEKYNSLHQQLLSVRDELSEKDELIENERSRFVEELSIKEQEWRNEMDRCRRHYLETVEQINSDLLLHIREMRENSAQQLREAVKNERREIYRKLKARKKLAEQTKNNDEGNIREKENNATPNNNKSNSNNNEHLFASDFDKSEHALREMVCNLRRVGETNFSHEF